jgi:site-specific recombinase XerD
MSAELVVNLEGGIDKADKLKELQVLVEKADENLQSALSANTRRAYASQWNAFAAWCDAMGLPSFPTSDKVLLIYLTHRVEKGAALTTITQAYSAIREEHRMKNEKPPMLDGKLYRSWTGARKKAKQSRKTKKAKALSPDNLKLAVGPAEDSLATRDRALLLVGWCAALRSDEITALNIEDISVEEDGLRIAIRQSKTDQFGAGHEIGVARSEGPTCPVTAWEDYLEGDVGLESGPAFVSRTGRRLSNKDVGRILTRRLKRAGVDSAGYSAHSLRAGCITAAAVAGHSLEAIQRQSRHKSLEVLLGYIRTATLLTDNVTKGLL